jgi:hypothetical protein
MTMRTHSPVSQPWSRILLFALWVSTHISPAMSIPRSLSPRQTVFDNLKLPPCALTCFVNEVQKDECADQMDFACHCGQGDIMKKTAKCVKQKCNPVEEADATRKVQVACGGLGVDDSNGATSTAPAPSSQRTTEISAPGSIQSAVPSGNNGISSPVPSSRPMSGASSLPSASSTPTNAPFGAQPPSSQLSHSAKIGIAISVSLLAIALFLLLGWYILRLKRDLKTAQAHIDTTPEMSAAPTRWPSHRGQSPVSPLSPMEVSDNGYGVLKKKRGNVLSVVAEQENEDRSSLMREPVPGQREGLSQAVELDGEHTGLVEAPLSITPRERSRER